MTIRTRLGAAALIAASLASVSVADAATKITTKLSITADEGEFSGSLSAKKAKCEIDRKVSLFQQKGAFPNKTKDKRIGSDTSNEDGDWKVETEKEGTFYARTAENKSCKGALSKRVKAVEG